MLTAVVIEDLGGGIDVSLDDVSAEPVAGAQGALEVDRVSRCLGSPGWCE